MANLLMCFGHFCHVSAIDFCKMFASVNENTNRGWIDVWTMIDDWIVNGNENGVGLNDALTGNVSENVFVVCSNDALNGNENDVGLN